MKKILTLLLFFILCFLFLSACDKLDPAPEKQIEYDIEDYLINHQHANSIEYDIDHDLDKDSRLDTVTITLTADYNYYKIEELGTYIYQHDRSSDIWSQYREPEWITSTIQYDEFAYLGLWEGAIYSPDGSFKEAEYKLDITDIDFRKSTITCNYSIAYDSLYQDDLPDKIEGSGTFRLYPVFDFGYGLVIDDSGYTNVFSLKGEPYAVDFYTSYSGYDLLSSTESNGWVFDWSLLFSEAETNSLQQELSSIVQNYKCGIYIATIDDAELVSSESFDEVARSIYTDFCLGVDDGSNILLVINSATQNYSIYASGPAFTSYGREFLKESIQNHSSQLDWYSISSEFLSTCNVFLALAESNIPVDMFYTLEDYK